MRAAFIAAAFAATAIAVPLEKRNVVVTNTEVDVVYVTQYQTVTAGQAEASPSPAAAESPASPQKYGSHWGHKPWWGGKPNKGHTKEPETTAAATTEAPATTPKATWAPSPTTQAPAPATTAPSTQPASGYSGIVVQQHNIHRANHSASDLQWDSGLASIAGQIAATCNYEHNVEMGGGGYGQNIAAGVDASGVDRVITDMFYNGEVNYYEGLYGQAQPDMSNFEHWGHFSQIVWKATTHVGCATQHCPGGLANTGSGVQPYFTVCNYKSPGNFANEYGDNVGKPLGQPTVTA